MRRPERRDVERQRYWRGQKLRSIDFRDCVANDDQLRWWHNRAIHEAFGIREGLEVIPNPDGKTLTVKAGIGYDCFGRELILAKERTVDIPVASHDKERFALILRRRSTVVSCLEEKRQKCCRSNESASELIWKSSNVVCRRDGLILYVKNHAGAKLAPGSSVQKARPITRPRLAGGDTIPGNTAWEPWTISRDEQTVQVGIQTFVDTSSAGFVTDPHYFASLNGQAETFGQGEQPFPLFTHIAESGPAGFLFRCLLVPCPGRNTQLLQTSMDISAVEERGEAHTVISVADTGKLRAGELAVLHKADGTLMSTPELLHLKEIAPDGKLAVGGTIPNVAEAATIIASGVARDGSSVRLKDPISITPADTLTFVWMEPKGAAPEIITVKVKESVGESGIVHLHQNLPQKKLHHISTGRPMILANFTVPHEHRMRAYAAAPDLYVSWIGCEEQWTGPSRDNSGLRPAAKRK